MSDEENRSTGNSLEDALLKEFNIMMDASDGPKPFKSKENKKVEEEIVAEEPQPVEVQEEVSDEVIEPIEVSEVEALQQELGFDPNGEYDWETFQKVHPLIKKSRNDRKRFNKAVRKLKEQVDALTGKIQDASKKGYEQALEDLKEKRRAALELGELDMIDHYDDEAYNLRRKLETEESIPDDDIFAELLDEDELVDAPASSDPISPALEAFQKRNASWLEDPEMMAAALQYKDELIDRYESTGGLSEEVGLAMIEKYIKKSYPAHFKGTNAARPAKVVSSAVAGDSNAASAQKAKYRLEDVDPKLRAVFLEVKKYLPDKTLDQFIDEINSI